MIQALSALVFLLSLSPSKALSLIGSSLNDSSIPVSAAPFTCPEGDLTGLISYANSNHDDNPTNEPQPENLLCEVDVKRPVVMLSKIDVWVSSAVAMSGLALQQWADYLGTFRAVFADTDFKFASSKAPGIAGLHIKEILWAMRILLCYMQANDYTAIQFRVKYESNPPIGFGQILSTVSMSGNSSLDGNMTNGTTTAGVETGSAMFNNTQSLPQDLVGQDTDTNQIAVTDIQAGGESFRPYVIYSLLESLLISEAEYNDKELSTPGVIGFDNQKQWSMGVLATSAAAVDNLTHRTVILALSDLAKRMPTVAPPQLRWRELNFRIRRNGAIVGRGYIRRVAPPPSVMANDTVAIQ